MPFTTADQRSAPARIGLAIAIGLCLMLVVVLLVRPQMMMRLMHDVMGAF